MASSMRGQQAELRFGDVLLLALQHAIVLATVDSYGTQWVSKSQYFLGFIDFDLRKCCKVCKNLFEGGGSSRNIVHARGIGLKSGSRVTPLAGM